MSEPPHSLEFRVRHQFPALFITLVSVLIGLVLADLVAEARARMVLWPLSLATLRTWAQLGAMGTSALLAWIVYSHTGITRERVPTLMDSLIAFLVPIPLLIGTTLVGRDDIWPWFYYASGYLVLSMFTVVWMLRAVGKDTQHAPFRAMLRPSGMLSIFYAGIPFFAAAGWADSHGWLSPWQQDAIAASPIPAALILGIIFFHDWRRAIATPLG
ncbi:MAG: hypothetical protein WBQ17_07890 [Rhizomicrobium sp.]